MTDPDSLDGAQLRQQLPGWQVEIHAELGSTNRYLHESDTRSTPAIVVAIRQTAGRGRGSNRWWSETGCLTFSLLIQPQQWNISAQSVPLLSLYSAAVLRQTLIEQTGLARHHCLLKWPNDLYLQGKKCCGILLEQPAGPEQQLIIGVGVNVNNSFEHAPRELQSKSISIKEAIGQPVSQHNLLVNFVCSLERLLQDFEQMQKLFDEVRYGYHLLNDQLIHVEQPQQMIVGICEGIDRDGTLLIRTDSGLKQIHSGVVSNWQELEL